MTKTAPKEKAAPICRESADYKWKLAARDYDGDKEDRDDARRLEAKARAEVASYVLRQLRRKYYSSSYTAMFALRDTNACGRHHT